MGGRLPPPKPHYTQYYITTQMGQPFETNAIKFSGADGDRTNLSGSSGPPHERPHSPHSTSSNRRPYDPLLKHDFHIKMHHLKKISICYIGEAYEFNCETSSLQYRKSTNSPTSFLGKSTH